MVSIASSSRITVEDTEMTVWHDGEVNGSTFFAQNVHQGLSEGYTQCKEQVLFLITVRHPFVLSLMANTNLAIVGLYCVANNHIALHLCCIMRATASLAHFLTGNGEMEFWLLWLSFLLFRLYIVKLIRELQWFILVCYIFLQYCTSTLRTEAISISLTFVVIEYLGIARVTIRANREKMRFRHIVCPVISINQLSTNSCIDITVHDSGLVLIHIRHETNRLNQFQPIVIIHSPFDLITERRIIYYRLVTISIDGLVCFVVVIIHVGDFNTTNDIYYTIHCHAVARRILGDGITQ